MADVRRARTGERGAVLIEITVTVFVFLVILFGIVDFSRAFYQWNAATKAVQLGARYAATNDPVLQQLPTIDGRLGGAMPGDPYTGTFDVLCDGSQDPPSCSCTGTECPTTRTYVANAMTGIVNAMKKAYPEIVSTNVKVRYTYTNLGYVSRPGGPVPTITVSLTGLKFKFILLSFMFRNDITMPPLETTVTGEDLKSTWTGS